MLQLSLAPTTKEIGLRELQQRGWVLIDAIYHPVDKLPKDRSHDRDEVIAKDYPLLLVDLSTLTPDRSIPLVLIKANVCRILDALLTKDGSVCSTAAGRSIFPAPVSRRNLKVSLELPYHVGSPSETG